MTEIKPRVLKADPNAKFIVVTPLLPGHTISRDTKVTIKRNKYPFIWIQAEGKNNIPTNAFAGIDWYLMKKSAIPDYYIMIDRDIRLGRNMLDRLYDKLSKAPLNVAYAYASFKFVGAFEREFPAIGWDINKLLMHNYISSNSMFRTSALYEVGPVTDEKYKRLLDWAFLLKLFYERGWIGVPCPEATFEAVATPKSISAGSTQDYDLKRKRVIEDFCKPILEKYTQQQQAAQMAQERQQKQREEVVTMDF